MPAEVPGIQLDKNFTRQHVEPILLREINFIAPGVGGFGDRFTGLPVTAAFSWGDGANNMAEKYASERNESPDDIHDRRVIFLHNAGLTLPPRIAQFTPRKRDVAEPIGRVTTDMIEDHVQTIEATSIYSARKRPKKMLVGSDFLFTTEPGVTIFALPADCHTSIIHARGSEGDMVGMLHTGHEQIAQGLPTDGIKHLVEQYDVDPSEISIGISPGLAPENYFFKSKDVRRLGNGWEKHLTVVENHPQGKSEQGVLVDALGKLVELYEQAGVSMGNITAHDRTIDTYEAAARGEAFSHRHSTVNKLPQGRMIVAGQLLTS